MKFEMFEFALNLAGVESYAPYMKAPRGHYVLDFAKQEKMTRMERYHARHFPRSQYDFGRGMQHGMSPVGYGAIVGVYSVAGVYAVSYPFLMATAQHPEVSSKTYQTAMSGQPAGSDPRLVFNQGEGIFSYFKRGWQ